MTETAEAIVEEAEPTTGGPYVEELLPALRRLDHLLERAAAAAQVAYGPEASADSFRGLYISQAEMKRLLARQPGEPVFQLSEIDSETPWSETLDDVPRLEWLHQVFNLSTFDVDLILIALAPELDRRYERLYAYLQDNVSHRRPSVDLALNLLCPDAAARLERRVHFAADAPLIRHHLVRLAPDPNQIEPSLLAHTLKLDEQIVRFLLHQDSLDDRLAPFCELILPPTFLDELPLNAEVKRALPTMVSQAWEERRPLRLYFHGPHGGGKRHAAQALAGELGMPLLTVDLRRALDAKTDWEQVLRLTFRAAWFQSAILYLDGLDALRCDSCAIPYERLLDTLAEDAGITILSGTQMWVPSARRPLGVLSIPFPMPDFARRRDTWHRNLIAAGITPTEPELDALAGRFRLTPGQIAEAIAAAQGHARWRLAAQSTSLSTLETEPQATIRQTPELSAFQAPSLPTIQDLFVAARAQSGHDLTRLARRISPLYTWDDIVLPDDAMSQLREICGQVNQRQRVLGEWGFDRKLSQGKGVNALFAGPSGTGKTMAAEIIANELGLDLYKIDLAGVVSKYIGETEKNLDRIFRAAENANAILFFDEADALFGKRSEVRDSHDRYANIEISYLLQKMEEYDGLAILATNLRQNLDESFIRRLAFTVHFPFPDEASRRRIWTGIWPVETPLADDVDFDFLACQFKLTGGNIKNIALAAAFLAAEAGAVLSSNGQGDDDLVTIAHLLQATRREYQKMGKVLSEAELNGSLREGKP